MKKIFASMLIGVTLMGFSAPSFAAYEAERFLKALEGAQKVGKNENVKMTPSKKKKKKTPNTKPRSEVRQFQYYMG